MRDREKNRGTMLVSTAVILCVATFAIGFAGGTLVANHSAPAPASYNFLFLAAQSVKPELPTMTGFLNLNPAKVVSNVVAIIY